MPNKVVKIYSAVNLGLNGQIVEIQADILGGLPATHIVGLPDSAVEESKERVKAAIKNSGFKYPDSRVVINLAPADLAKSGSGFDLPIAIAILSAAGYIASPSKDQLFIGELGLDGELRASNAVLAKTLAAHEGGFKEVFVSKENLAEAELVSRIKIFTPKSLEDIVLHLSNTALLKPHKKKVSKKKPETECEVDFADIAGQKMGHTQYMVLSDIV